MTHKTALISDVHSNTEALEAVRKDMVEEGIDQVVFLGDIVGYGPNPGEVIDEVSEMVWAGARILPGNHDKTAYYKLVERLKGLSSVGIKLGMGKRPSEALEKQIDMLFTEGSGDREEPKDKDTEKHEDKKVEESEDKQDSEKAPIWDPKTRLKDFLSAEYIPKIRSSASLEYRPSLMEDAGKLIREELAEADFGLLGNLLTRCARKEGLPEMFDTFMQTKLLGIILNEVPYLYEKNRELLDKIKKHKKARERFEFLKGLSDPEKYDAHLIVNGIHCFHTATWDKSKGGNYPYLYDPHQRKIEEVKEEIEKMSRGKDDDDADDDGVIPVVGYRSALDFAKKLGRKKVYIAKGHTHVPSIFRTTEGGIEIVIIDAGSVGIQRIEEWTGVDYKTGSPLEPQKDCLTMASYAIMESEGTNGNGFSNVRIKWVKYDLGETHRKMEKLGLLKKDG